MTWLMDRVLASVFDNVFRRLSNVERPDSLAIAPEKIGGLVKLWGVHSKFEPGLSGRTLQ